MSNDSTIYIAPCGCGYQDGRTDRQTLACPAHLYAGMLAQPSRLMEEPKTEKVEGNLKPFSELQKSGLLWFINRTVFHPIGFALALSRPDKESEPDSWQLLGDGITPWEMGDTNEEAKSVLAKVREILSPKL